MYKREIYYFSLLALDILMCLFAICSIIQQIYYCTLSNVDAFYNVMGIFYMVFHLICLGFSIYAIIKSLQHGSYVFNTLAYDPSGKNTIVPKIISGILGTICLSVFIFFLLYICNVNTALTTFPKVLAYSAINATLFVFIHMGYFFVYPFLFPYHHTKGTHL